MDRVGLPISGTTKSALTHVEGALSGRTYNADSLIGLDPADGKPLLARYDLSKAARTLTGASLRERPAGGLWRWHELLPVRDWEFVVHLGEGSTPLESARRLGSLLGLPNLLLKRESINPTGSFKARGMAVAVSRAVELGAGHLVAPSAGNAGGALAAYAAAAGVRATIVMPSDSPAVNQTETLIAGANLILLDGLISDCGRLARLIADRLGAFDMSTLKEPYRIEGKKTMGFEIAEQLGWRLPDAIVYPTGGGTGLIGMWKAFDELEALGLPGGRLCPDRASVRRGQAICRGLGKRLHLGGRNTRAVRGRGFPDPRLPARIARRSNRRPGTRAGGNAGPPGVSRGRLLEP